MADSFIQGNTDGSGKKLDTRVEGTNSEHRPVMVVGDPSSNSGVAPVDATNGLGVQIIPALPVGANLIGKVQVVPATSGGALIYRLFSAATTNGNNIKASAGQLFGGFVYNAAASVKYLKFYNKASAPTIGTDTPVMTIPLPATTLINLEQVLGVEFTTGIGIGVSGALADNDTTAVAANDVVLNLLYK